jgi:hypothetical protein
MALPYPGVLAYRAVSRGIPETVDSECHGGVDGKPSDGTKNSTFKASTSKVVEVGPRGSRGIKAKVAAGKNPE